MRLCGRDSAPQSVRREHCQSPTSVLTGTLGTSFLNAVIAECYLRNIHITQPATMTPPTNMQKQYRP